MHKIGAFSLTMIAIGAIISVRTLPEIAAYGITGIFFVLIATILFVIPIAIVSIEFSMHFTNGAGMYTWVKSIFNKKIGFFEVYIELVINVILMTLLLTFICSNILYLIGFDLVDLSKNKFLIFILNILIFCFVTYINLKGFKISVLISLICTILGVFIPMLSIILFGAYIMILYPELIIINLDFNKALFNFYNITYWTALSSVALAFSGLEVITVHVRNVFNVKRDYTIAIIAFSIVAIVFFIIAPLSIAMIVSNKEIIFSLGVSQVLTLFFNKIGFNLILVYVIVILTCIGTLGALNSWVISGVKPLFIASEDKLYHKIFAISNKYGAPIVLLICQAVAVIIFQILILFMPTINDYFWIITVLCCQNAVLVYIIVFFAYLKFIYYKKNLLWIKIFKSVICITGIIFNIIIFLIGFVPNPLISFVDNKLLYFIIIFSLLVISWLPAIPLYLSGDRK